MVGQVKQRPVVSVRDASSAGRRVRVGWRKRRWACLEPTCERGVLTEQHEAVGARRRTTRRCREQIATAVTRGRAVAEAADEVGLGWRAAMSAVAEHANSPTGSGPWSISASMRPSPGRRRRFVTHLVDLDTGTVIATVEGRSATVLLQALAAQGVEWLARVEQVAIDPFTPYAKAVRHLLPHAVLVVDKFHVLRLFAALSTRSAGAPSARPRAAEAGKIDLLWRSRMVLLKRFERLTDAQQQRLFDALDGEDHGGRSPPPTSPTKKPSSCSTDPAPTVCGPLSASLFRRLAHREVPESMTLGRTLDRWLPRSSPTSRPAPPTPPPKAATAR